MKVLSIDVGIKNLAFCLLENGNIIKWDIVNVSETESFFCSASEKGILCNKPAKFIKDQKCFCAKHAKKQTYQIPTSELKLSYINKQKIQKLFELVDKYNIKYEKPIKKCDLVELLCNYVNTTCFDPIQNVNSSKLNLVTIGKNIKNKFDDIFSQIPIDHVIIENQISPIANRMKTIQGMIAQYFIMRNSCPNIEFVSAINKLKEFTTPHEKTSYADRKKLGISKSLEILKEKHSSTEWYSYFASHKKKDDLADAFLQAIWFCGLGKYNFDSL